jgi:hypothetical protein
MVMTSGSSTRDDATTRRAPGPTRVRFVVRLPGRAVGVERSATPLRRTGVSRVERRTAARGLARMPERGDSVFRERRHRGVAVAMGAGAACAYEHATRVPAPGAAAGRGGPLVRRRPTATPEEEVTPPARGRATPRESLAAPNCRSVAVSRRRLRSLGGTTKASRAPALADEAGDRAAWESGEPLRSQDAESARGSWR